jgi:hypothetical protein
MADRTEELRATAAQCLALSRSTTDPRTRTNLLIMAQKLCDMANSQPGVFEKVQQEFNDHHMLSSARLYPQPTVQQQQQIQPKTDNRCAS